MKKLLILLLTVLLGACSSNTVDEKKETYIKPYKEEEVFKYLNDDIYSILYSANNENEIETYALDKLGLDLPSYVLTDVYGNRVDLSEYKDKKLVIELSAYWCSHCKDQALLHTDKILEKYEDLIFINYFNEGDIEGIKAFYKDIGMDVPDNVICIPYDEGFSNLILNEINPKYYPSFLSFNNGVLTYVKGASFTTTEFDKAYDVMFNNPYTREDLVDYEGNSIFEHTRTKEDVKKDLGDKYLLLEEIDNDEYSINLSLTIMGKDIGYLDQLSDESNFKSEVDFTDYENKDLAIISLYKPDDKSVELINQLYRENEDIEIIVLDVADDYTKEMADKLDCKVVSIMNQVPKTLNDISFLVYPSAIFVRKGIITGAYSNILNKEMFKRAKEIFLGENSIAIIK
ncbi:MAG: hypothetical protein Q4B60_08365 [Erysipelotrichaceae bacterium]|nr:hypothetical protein [Erysipelotrichaceae bacterium]